MKGKNKKWIVLGIIILGVFLIDFFNVLTNIAVNHPDKLLNNFNNLRGEDWIKVSIAGVTLIPAGIYYYKNTERDKKIKTFEILNTLEVNVKDRVWLMSFMSEEELLIKNESEILLISDELKERIVKKYEYLYVEAKMIQNKNDGNYVKEVLYLFVNKHFELINFYGRIEKIKKFKIIDEVSLKEYMKHTDDLIKYLIKFVGVSEVYSDNRKEIICLLEDVQK